MLSNLFINMALLGAEWVLYVLVLLSIISVALILERARYFKRATRDIAAFRDLVRTHIAHGAMDKALDAAENRLKTAGPSNGDFDTQLVITLLEGGAKAKASAEALEQLARDSLIKSRLNWERGLAVLATIGNNAPFIGLFGTVLGVIQAFHELSQKATAGGAQGVTAGISDALVATAVGILVAIPAAAAFNMFQRRVKTAFGEAEALKSYIVGKLIQ